MMKLTTNNFTRNSSNLFNIIPANRRSSRETLHQNLGLESIQSRRWYRKETSIFKEKKPVYLFNLILTKNLNYNTRNTDKIALLHAKHNFFKKIFFPSTVIEWKKLDPNFRSAASLRVFKIICLKFISPSPESVFNCHNCKGTKYLTRLCLSLNDLHEHKLNIVFKIL